MAVNLESFDHEPTGSSPVLERERVLAPGLPAPTTPLIGRDETVANLVRLIEKSGVMLVTLTGPGGIGKTRLALEVAMRSSLPAAFVALDAIVSPDLILPTIERALDLDSDLIRSPFERVVEYVSNGLGLLVLDNFEHLLVGQKIVNDLLAACPDLTMLVTSRVPLGLADERTFPIEPLAVPMVATDVDVFRESAAVRLFVERAQAVNPAFELSVHNAGSVLEICQKLDGLPLAIELAAARAHLLAPDVLAQRLGSHLELLAGGPRDRPLRQQTMQAAIAWSYELLSERQRRIWEQLSVFSGGFLGEAAAQIVGEDLAKGNFTEEIDLLVRHGLVRESTGRSGRPRYALLETMRQFGVEALQLRGNEAEVRRRHGEWFLRFAGEAKRGMRTSEIQAWHLRIEDELGNIRQAAAWLRDTGSVDLALELVSSLSWFWSIPHFLVEGRRLCDELIALAPPGTADEVLAHGYEAAGSLADWQHDIARARECYLASLAIWRKLDNRFEIGFALQGVGGNAIDREDFAEAITVLSEALSIGKELGETFLIADSSVLLGIALAATGQYRAAIPYHEESLRILTAAGHGANLRARLTALGSDYCFLGDYERSREYYMESLDRCSEEELYSDTPTTMAGFAYLASFNGQPELAVTLFAIAAAQRLRLGLPARPHIERRNSDTIEQLRDRLGTSRFTRAWNAGQTTSLPDSFALARSVTIAARPDEPGLTSREREVLHMLVEGGSDIEIADRLFISRRTASKHVARILEKLDAPNRTAAAIAAQRRGLL
jgi:predicted ATPase/DNA-binding CsgD family transcriptional regulator